LKGRHTPSLIPQKFRKFRKFSKIGHAVGSQEPIAKNR
jgi:hypothetical protein